MENEGVELALRSFVYKSNDWNVSLFVNMAHNKNRIVSISNALSSYNDKADQNRLTMTTIKPSRWSGIKREDLQPLFMR